MKLLQKEMEEDRRRLEEQFRTDMETQRVLMQDMMTANMDEQRSERQAIIDQKQILEHTMEVRIIVFEIENLSHIDYDSKEAQRKAELTHIEQERKMIEVIDHFRYIKIQLGSEA